jgi:hydrogenase nickel incorporation protein HypA/HybF
MHEMSLAQSLVDLAIKNAGGNPIVSLKVRVGPLSGVVTDSLDFCFDFVRQNTLAENAVIIYDRAPVSIRCKSCSAAVPVEQADGQPGHEIVYQAMEKGCPICGSSSLDVAGGMEFQLVEIEVSDQGAQDA